MEIWKETSYIDDIVDGIIKTIIKKPHKNKNHISLSSAPYQIYNIGNNKPISLIKFINTIEDACSLKAKINFLPMQPGDVPETYADIDSFVSHTEFTPSTTIEDGIKSFVDWYRECAIKNP